MKSLFDFFKQNSLKGVLILILSWLLGFASMTLVYKLDTAPMIQHVKESVNNFQQEGTYPQWSKGFIFTQKDNFTDAVMLSTAIYPKKDKSFIMALKNYNVILSRVNSGPTEALIYFVSGQKDKVHEGAYARYWHGYCVVLKPLLKVFSYGDIRCLNYIVQLALLALLFIKTHECLGWRGALALGMGVVVLNPVSATTSLMFSLIFYLSVLSCIALLLMQKHEAEDKSIFGIFFVTGILSSFFDFLSYPIASLGLPLCLILCCRNKNQVYSFQENLLFFVIASVVWGFGYFGMWIGKWILATLLTDQNVFLDAYRVALFRLDGEVPWMKGQELTALQVIKAQLAIFKIKAIVVAVLLFAIFLLAGLVKNRRKVGEGLLREKSLLLSLFFTAMLPMVWAIVLKNHSFIHAFFTHKGYCVTFFALAMLSLIICYPRNTDKLR